MSEGSDSPTKEHGGPEMAPKPPGWLGAPRRSRGAPRSRMGVNRSSTWGPRNGPQAPPGGSARPGEAEARLDASGLSIDVEAKHPRGVPRGDLADNIVRHPGEDALQELLRLRPGGLGVREV